MESITVSNIWSASADVFTPPSPGTDSGRCTNTHPSLHSAMRASTCRADAKAGCAASLRCSPPSAPTRPANTRFSVASSYGASGACRNSTSTRHRAAIARTTPSR